MCEQPVLPQAAVSVTADQRMLTIISLHWQSVRPVPKVTMATAAASA
jgi:hypothetical protein